MEKRAYLRKLIAGKRVIVAPGVYDCVSARIVEKLGFDTAFVSGYSLEASVLGNPDIGLATKTDVVTHARYIARSVKIPVICDADTGYGNAINVWEAVREFEDAGIAGIEIEDQTVPKKCGYMADRKLISTEEMVGKIEAAKDARRDGDFLIIARSDARGVAGVDEAIKRYNAYFDAGADFGVIAESYSVEDLRKATGYTKGPLGVAGGIPGRDETLLALEKYEKMGIKMVIFGLSALYAASRGVMDVYGHLRKSGIISPSIMSSKLMGFDEFNELIGLPFWKEIEKRYLKP
jgi:2-methylisocitrate lyase-like PEP mutase family enzyme